MSGDPPKPEDVPVPTGPLVSYGGMVGLVVAPGASSARGASIGMKVWIAHVLAALILLMVWPQLWPGSIALFLLGLAAGRRYAHNCIARHEKFLLMLKEKNPDLDVVEI